jgi:23S rRNA (guanosine2251-2'-O)-methyltransferase
MSKADWIYGVHAVQAVLERAPERALELRLLDKRDDDATRRCQALAKQFGVSLSTCNRQQMDHLLGEGANHQGVAARCRLAQALTDNDLAQLLAEASKPWLLLVLDGVTDPHNLGACLRSADAAGALAVITSKDKAVGLTPAVRKVAVGAAEVVPFVQVTNLARTLENLREQGVWVVGTALDERAQSLFEVDLRGNLALVMGAEGTGLRRLTKTYCDTLAYIPMAGSVASLNVSVATGICLFEARRQRLAISHQSA